MINVIHGQDVLSSRNFYNSKKTSNSLIFDAENLSIEDLAQSLQGQSMFENRKHVFIDNLFSRKAKNVEEIASLLKNWEGIEIYVYSDKELSFKQTSLLGKPQNHNFKFKESIFTFLEGLRPKNTRNVVLFRQALSFTEPEIILSMLSRQVRLLLSQLSQNKLKIEEEKRLAPWQQERLFRQAKLFGEESLLNFHKKLYKLDKDYKTGLTKLDLPASIDILLLEI